MENHPIPDPDGPDDEHVAASGSLSSRMHARAAELEAQHTVFLDIPCYEGILEAEYRMLGWPTIRKLSQRYRKVHDEGLRELYVACDTLITACEEIYEVLPGVDMESARRRSPTGERWLELARRGDAQLADDASPRQALIALCTKNGTQSTARIMSHYADYTDFLAGETGDVAEDVMRDFSTTG